MFINSRDLFQAETMSLVEECDVTELQTASELCFMYNKHILFVDQHWASKWNSHVSENFEKSTYIKKGVCICTWEEWYSYKGT